MPKGDAVRTPNHDLHEARTRAGLTRAELAERVARRMFERYGQVVAIDAHYVAKLERGVIRRPGAGYRKALRDVLMAPTDQALGLVAGPPNGTGDAGVCDANPVAGVVTSFRAADRAVGGTHLYSAAHHFLTRSSALASDERDGPAAEVMLTDMCGWMALDAGRHATSWQHFRSARRLAASAEEPELAAYTCASLAHLAEHTGARDDAVRYAVAGRERLCGGTSGPPSLHARLAAVEARARAGRGELRRSKEAMAMASDLASDDVSEDPWWLPVFDRASFLAESAVHALRCARYGLAEADALEVLARRRADRTRARALAGVTLAEIALARGDVDSAARRVIDVARTSRGLASAHVDTRAGAVIRALSRHRHRASVRELVELEEQYRPRARGGGGT